MNGKQMAGDKLIQTPDYARRGDGVVLATASSEHRGDRDGLNAVAA
jgi:hypothetical protein